MFGRFAVRARLCLLISLSVCKREGLKNERWCVSKRQLNEDDIMHMWINVCIELPFNAVKMQSRDSTRGPKLISCNKGSDSKHTC